MGTDPLIQTSLSQIILEKKLRALPSCESLASFIQKDRITELRAGDSPQLPPGLPSSPCAEWQGLGGSCLHQTDHTIPHLARGCTLGLPHKEMCSVFTLGNCFFKIILSLLKRSGNRRSGKTQQLLRVGLFFSFLPPSLFLSLSRDIIVIASFKTRHHPQDQSDILTISSLRPYLLFLRTETGLADQSCLQKVWINKARVDSWCTRRENTTK